MATAKPAEAERLNEKHEEFLRAVAQHSGLSVQLEPTDPPGDQVWVVADNGAKVELEEAAITSGLARMIASGLLKDGERSDIA